MKNRDIEDMLKCTNIEPSSSLKKRVVKDSAYIHPVEPEKKSFLFAHKKFVTLAAACCMLFIVILSGIGLYKEEYMKIYVDINPSIELTVNRFNIVIDVAYLNDDAKEVFVEVDVKGKDTDTALNSIMSTLEKKQYFTERSELYISCYSNKTDVADKVETLCNKVEKYKQSHQLSGNVNAQKLSKQDIEQGKQNGMSPMKNKLIDEILSIDNEKSKQDLKDVPMGALKSELNKLKEELGAGGKDNYGGGNNNQQNTKPSYSQIPTGSLIRQTHTQQYSRTNNSEQHKNTKPSNNNDQQNTRSSYTQMQSTSYNAPTRTHKPTLVRSTFDRTKINGGENWK